MNSQFPARVCTARVVRGEKTGATRKKHRHHPSENALTHGASGLSPNVAMAVAKMLNKHPWISYAGVFIVLYVALNMIWHGGTLMAAQY